MLPSEADRPDVLTVTLRPAPGDSRPVEIRWRLGLKLLRRKCGLIASWPEQAGHEPQEQSDGR